MKPSGPVFDSAWRAACEVVKVTRAEAQSMIQSHYLKKWPGVCVLVLALRHKIEQRLLGVIVYALPPRETNKRYGGETWELARLWLEDAVPKNAETYLIARSVRYIAQHFPQVKCLVSYADPSAGHSGVIYRAANWKDDGRTDGERKTPRFDYADAVTGKKYSRRKHIPAGVDFVRVPRVSKHRFVYRLA